MNSKELAISIMESVLEGNPQFFEWKHVRKDGTPFDSTVLILKIQGEDEVYIQGIISDKTEENRIQEENKLLATLANTTTNMVIMTDPKQKIEWVNRAFTEITGYEAQEVLGLRPNDLLQGEDSDQEVIKFMKEKLSKGEGFKDVEIINYTKDGVPYWVNIEVNPIHNEKGELVQFIAIESDVTEKKESRKILADSVERSRILIDQSPIGVIEWDLDFKVRQWNRAAENIFGYSREKAVGKHAEFILTEEVKPHVEQVWEALTSLKGGERSTNVNITRNGKHIMCEWYNNVLLNSNNELVGVVSMVEDITERLKADEYLKESELKFRQIVESSPMGIFMYEYREDKDLYLISVNKAANSILGVDCSQLVGLSILEAFPGLENTEMPDKFRRAAIEGVPWFTEDAYYDQGGIKGVYEVHAFQAGTNRMVVMFLDITERKKAEEAIKSKNEELVKINAELDRFVYSASHDLRAPIASLLGSIDVLRMEENPENIKKLLHMQEKSLSRLDDFIRDIVNYSRNTRMDVEVKQVDLKQEIEDALEQLYFMENVDQIQKKVSVDADTTFHSDQKRIKMILNNIISNGIKYADVSKENPFLDLEVSIDHEKAILNISDNGIGIDQEQIDSIFQMFYRASERSSGSGLGLYIVNEVVQRLGGNIEVESVLGEGTRFKIELPNLNHK